MDSPRMYLSTNRTSSLTVAELTPSPLHPLTTRQMDIDLDEGIFYRVGEAEKRYDNKRADPIRLPDRLLRLLRIWQRGPLRFDGLRQPRRYSARRNAIAAP